MYSYSVCFARVVVSVLVLYISRRVNSLSEATAQKSKRTYTCSTTDVVTDNIRTPFANGVNFMLIGIAVPAG